MTTPTIETARHLLADASPELRKAVGELVRGSMNASEERTIKSDWGTVAEFEKADTAARIWLDIARELIEGGKQ